MDDAPGEAAGRLMERYRLQLIAGIAFCGVLITLFSLAPWVRFHSISDELTTPGAPEASVLVRGTDLSRWRDTEVLGLHSVQNRDGWCSCRVAVGDGYLTAALGVVLLGIAGAGYVGLRDRPAGMAGVTASLIVLGTAGFNAVGKWQAFVWTELQALEVTKGTVQAWLWLLVAVAAIAAVLSGLLWGAGAEEMHEELLYEEEDEEWEEIADETDQYWEPHGGGPPASVS